MDPTHLGFYAMLLYPFLIIGYDAVLKFGLKRPTISSFVWSTGKGRFLVCSYLIAWTAGLSAHFAFMWLAG